MDIITLEARMSLLKLNLNMPLSRPIILLLHHHPWVISHLTIHLLSLDGLILRSITDKATMYSHLFQPIHSMIHDSMTLMN
jgi:hypothetical protein